MVKGQLWQCGQREPLRLCSIILASDGYRLFNYSEISHCNSSTSWVSINFGVSTNLMYLTHPQTRFLFQLTYSALLGCLIHIHETTGECPASFVWVCTTFYQ